MTNLIFLGLVEILKSRVKNDSCSVCFALFYELSFNQAIFLAR